MKQSYKLFVLLLLLFIPTLPSSAGTLVPVASVNDNTVCQGTTVTLTATGNGSITWHLTSDGSDAAIGTGSPFNTTPTTTTTYYAKDGDGMSNAVTVTVYTPPVITLGPAPTNNCSGSAVSFTSDVTGGTAPYTYAWTFSDGGTSSAADPSHTFSSFGCGTQSFTASVNVTDAHGCTDSGQQTVVIKQQPDLQFTDNMAPFAPEPFNNCGNASLSLPAYSIEVGNVSPSNSCVAAYTLNWGDGTPTVSNPTFPLQHTYNQLGVYNLTITATANNGCTITKTYPVKNISNPAGGLSSPGSTTNLCAPTDPLNFEITNWQSNSPGTTYTVNYGDGSTPVVLTHPLNNTNSNQPVPHVYTISNCPAPEFIATLTISNACGQTMSTINAIKIIKEPQPSFTNPANACVNTSVTFTNTSAAGFNAGCTTGALYNWNFGDGTQQSSGLVLSPQNITHTYTLPGTYTITLTAQNGCGVSDVAFTNQICIEAPLSSASFSLNNTVGCGSLTAQATNTTPTANACNVTYNWGVSYTASNCGTSPGNSYNYFTGGTTNTSANPSFNFPNPGTYTVTLTASNSCGSQVTTQTVTVKAQPTVNIGNIPNICGGTSATISPTATMNNCATQTPLAYAWSFPGGTPATSNLAVPGAISYTTSGTYTVTLAVTNECGTTIDTETFTVTPGVTANAGTDQTLCAGESVQLAGTGSGGSGGNLIYSWSPTTDLTGSNTATPTANPNATTTYTLTVSTGTGSNACSATDQVTVYRNTVNQGVIGADQTICYGGDPAAFTVITAATGTGTLTYQWESSVTNATSGYTDIPGATASTYDAPALTQTTWFRRRVTSTLNGEACTATGNFVTVYINTITPGTISSDQTICSGGDPVVLTGTAATGGGTFSYQWQSSADGVTFNNITGAGTTSVNYNPPVLTQNTWYRRIDTSSINGSSCSDFTNQVAITLTTPPSITQDPLASQTLCAGGTATALTVTATGGAGLSYQWYANTANNNTSGTAISNATTATYAPLTNTVGTTYYYCVVSTGVSGCTDASATAQVTVIAAPVVSSQPQPQTLCEGQVPVALSVAYQNGTGVPAYQWYSNNTNSTLGGTPISGATATTYLPPATMGANYYYTIITFPGGGCSVLTSNVVAIVINQKPVITTTATATICSSESFSITPPTAGNTIPAGTTYSWSAPLVTGGLTGGQAGSGTMISGTLTNPSNTTQTASYTVTPSANGCAGTPFTITVTVNPKPFVANQTLAVCSGEPFTITPQQGSGNIVPAGTTYSWPAPVVSGGITNAQAGTNETTISNALTNTTNSAQTGTYTVTPTWASGTETCIGNTFTITVTVNPQPAVNNLTEDSCSGVAFSVIPVNATDGVVPTNTQYVWVAPAPISGISGLAAGSGSSITGTLTNTNTNPVTVSYTVTPTSGTCVGQNFTVAVTVAPTPTVAAVPSLTVCNGDTVPQTTFTQSVANTVFNWTNSNTVIGLGASGVGNITPFTAANSTNNPITATITVTPEVNGCTGTPQTFSITVNPAPVAAFSINPQTLCSGTMSAAVTLSSLTPNTTITWTANIPTGITGATQNTGTTTIPVQTLVNTTGTPLTITYTATASTAGTATCPGASSTYTITVNPVPFTGSQQAVATCSGTALNFIPANGGANNIPTGTTFTWTAPTGNGFTGGSAQTIPQTSLNQTLVNTTNAPVIATYTVTPQANGCTGLPFTVVVTVNPTAIIPNATLNLCSGTSFSFNPATVATLLPAGTVYSWSAPTGNISGGASGSAQSLITGTLNNTSATAQIANYFITSVSPDGNCAGTPFTLAVTVNPVFAVTNTVSNYNGFQISSAGANDAFINLSPTGGTGTYTYSWSGPNGFTASTQNITNLGPGTYTAVINDGLCNSITVTVTIAEPLPLIIAEVVASHVDVDCFGQSTGVIEVEITTVSIAPFDYAILLPNGTVVESVDNFTALNYVFDNLPAGTYNVRVTDANGTVKFINGIQITQPANGLTITNAAITNFNGFSISCNGAQDAAIDLTVGGGYPGYTYSWTGPGGFTATTEDIANLSPGVYTVTILDTTNACPLTQSYTITEPAIVAFTGTVPQFNGFEVSCNGGANGSITITPSGGTSAYSYSWTGPNGFTSTAQNLTGLSIGTYQLTMADSNGCTAPVQSFTLTEPAPLAITESHVNVLCFGAATGAIDVSVTGGVANGMGTYTFAWTGPGGFTSATEDLVNIVAGTYNLLVTDANGCTIPLSVTITQQSEIIITPTTTPITCYGADNGSISLAITGGDPPYSAAWSNLATGTYQDNLGAGSYVITVTDESGCVKPITVVIPQAPVFMVTPTFNNISCHGAQDGNITLNLVGGIAPVTLVWSDGSTAGTTRNNLGPGTYTATITDGTPCQIIRTFTIIEPAALTVTANLTHALDCDDTASGAINLLVAGGTPPYTYAWSNGETTEDLATITSGTYSVTVTDTGGCTATSTYTITRPDPLVLNVTSDVAFSCTNHTVVQTNIAQAAGGVPPFQYTWSSGTVTGAQGQFMNTDQNGTVIVTATDAYGCTATATFDVQTQQLGEANFTAGSYAFTTYQEYSILDPVQFDNLSTGDYTEVGWDFGDGASSNELSPSHTYLREGTYTVTLHVVYPYGCSDTFQITLVVTKGYDVMVPNAFTPNADGSNDTFNAVHKGLKEITLDVFDTWGALIYSEKGDIITGWNGFVKGNPAENGNFYYRIKAETFYGQVIEFNGPFVLIK